MQFLAELMIDITVEALAYFAEEGLTALFKRRPGPG